MKSKKSGIQALVGQVLLYTLTLNSFIGLSGGLSPAHAQRRIIVVNADQPNLWTLEQAHYLLAQMHRRNLDLKAKSLEELDPNEIAGLRFDVMRMLVEFGATFNQADLVSNRMLSANQSFNSERRQQLLTERDGLRRESVDLAGEIEALETEKASTEDKDAQKVLDAKIAAKTNRLTRVDKEIETLNGELGTLNAPSGQPTATTGGATFDPSKLPKSDFDDAFKAAAAKQIEKFNQSPELNASLKLDNFLQMQYEIISKQLSLLRDELGPGERLVFLELPQTVNAAHHESNKKWAQSWWKIAGYTRRERAAGGLIPVPAPTPRVDEENEKPITISRDIDSIFERSAIDLKLSEPRPCTINTPYRFTDTRVINIKDGPPPPPPAAPVKPSPSSITVEPPGRVTKVTVTLNSLRHVNPDDIDILLVGPQGQNALLMSDVGGTTDANDLTITLDDAAANPLLDAGPLANGTFQPTDVNDGSDDSPATALRPLGGSALSIFNGTNPAGEWKLYVMDDNGPVSGSIGGWSLNITTDCMPSARNQVSYQDVFINLDGVGNGMPGNSGYINVTTALQSYLTNNRATLENRKVRTVELIPRQSSLNVNDMNLKVKAGALNFVFSSLFGFGAQLKAQRQREQFSQFVQQELYSAAFGKGSREFGWTFTPMPGTDRLHSGVRTTYAVVVVPEEATSLVMESNGCYFPRSYYPPNNFADTKEPEWNNDNRTSRNCGGESTRAFVVPIPAARLAGGNEFWVERIEFQPVGKGKRIVVAIRGKNFSPQIGALINGVPLVQSIGLAQPLIRDDSAMGRATAEELKDVEIPGNVERIDADKVLVSFRMPSDFQGTPTITLIAPGRATDINLIPNVDVNELHGIKLADYPRKMFGHGPGPDPFRIDRVKVFRSRTAGKLTAQVSGAGFGSAAAELPLVLVNGSSETPNYVSATVLTVDFAIPPDETVRLTLVSKKGETIESDSVANPASFLSISNVEVVSYEPATEDDPTSALLVKITGTGFTDNLKATFGEKTLEVAVKSATEAVIAIPDPKAASIVTLEDTVTKQKVKVVVTRKSKSKPK
jgi:subtilisin-like proprotein convertase family protein